MSDYLVNRPAVCRTVGRKSLPQRELAQQGHRPQLTVQHEDLPVRLEVPSESALAGVRTAPAECTPGQRWQATRAAQRSTPLGSLSAATPRITASGTDTASTFTVRAQSGIVRPR